MHGVIDADRPSGSAVVAPPSGTAPALAVHVARSTSAQVVLMLGGALASLVALRIAANHLGPQSYGAVAAALALVTLLAVLADLGLGLVGAREAARAPDHASSIVLTLALVRSVLGVLLVPVALGLGAALYGSGSDSFRAVVVLSPMLPMLAVQSAIGVYFVARGRNALNVASSTLTAVALLAGSVAVARLGLQYRGYAVAVLASEAVGLVATASLLFADRPRGVRLLSSPATRAVFALALPLAAVQVLNVVYLRADTVILGALRPGADVGEYSVAFQVTTLVMALPSLFMIALLPTVANADMARTRALMQRAMEVSTTVAIPIMLCIVVCAPVVISVVSETRFTPGASALQLLAVGAACSYGSAVYGNSLIARGLQGRIVHVSVAVAGANVALNLALIPLLGMAGAATAMAVSELLALVLMARAGHRLLGFRPSLGSLSPAVLAGAVAAAIAGVAALTHHSADGVASAVLEVGVVMVVYAAALAALGGLRPFRGLRARAA